MVALLAWLIAFISSWLVGLVVLVGWLAGLLVCCIGGSWIGWFSLLTRLAWLLGLVAWLGLVWRCLIGLVKWLDGLMAVLVRMFWWVWLFGSAWVGLFGW